jgi:hypothetical protein
MCCLRCIANSGFAANLACQIGLMEVTTRQLRCIYAFILSQSGPAGVPRSSQNISIFTTYLPLAKAVVRLEKLHFSNKTGEYQLKTML